MFIPLLAVQVTAEELCPEDMVLVGDDPVGLAVFSEVSAVLIDELECTIRLHSGHEFVVNPTTEVMRLEQGKHPFGDGHRGFPAGRAVQEPVDEQTCSEG